jgi:hypothetical protein
MASNEQITGSRKRRSSEVSISCPYENNYMHLLSVLSYTVVNCDEYFYKIRTLYISTI